MWIKKNLIEWSYWNQADTFYNQPFDILSDEKRKEITDMHDKTGKKLSEYVVDLVVRRELYCKSRAGQEYCICRLVCITDVTWEPDGGKE